MRQQVLARDGACVVCGVTEGLEAHHVHAAADGGPTTLENLVLLCAGCHDEAEAEKRV